MVAKWLEKPENQKNLRVRGIRELRAVEFGVYMPP